jgi:hypothetical protein
MFDIGVDDKCLCIDLPPGLRVDVRRADKQHQDCSNGEEQMMLTWALWASSAAAQLLPPVMICTAVQTAGFHDFPHNEEAYEPVSFFESSFELRINRVLMRHLDPDAPADLYLTLKDESTRAELNCRKVRGAGNTQGLSCSNLPPSELLLINVDNLRFTRTSIGGWAFAAATENTAGDSLYVEYGTCTPK